MQPEPGEHQHDDGDGKAEDEPRAEVYHLCVWITAGKTETEFGLGSLGCLHICVYECVQVEHLFSWK